jgi:hypothetical protein
MDIRIDADFSGLGLIRKGSFLDSPNAGSIH